MSTPKEPHQGQNIKVFTKEDLLNYYYLEQEIKADKEDIAELQSKTTCVTKSFSNMPRGQASKDARERAIVKLVDKKDALCEKMIVAASMRNEILKYIISIDDAKIRLILQLKYLDFLTWKKVAEQIGGNNTPDGLKVATERFFKKQSH